MSIANHCRIKAAESREKAQNERVPMIKAEWENLAKVYLRLAQHVDRNAAADIVNEQADITQQHTQSVPVVAVIRFEIARELVALRNRS